SGSRSDSAATSTGERAAVPVSTTRTSSSRASSLALVRSPVPDRSAAHTLGSSLRGLGYEGDAISDLIGDDIAEREEVVVAERRLSESPLETAIRLLYLELAVPERKAVAAFGSGGVDALLALNL